MSLPPGFLDDLRSRVPLSRVVGRKVTWDRRKTNAAKGDFWAPCPFHQEKTPSFHVDDRKGFYYCFGCHAKGDALTFLRESDNMGFREAVETLAREAGMVLPDPDPEVRARSDRRAGLAEVMEAAVQHYRLQLRAAAGAEARAYLARRGLSDGAIERFDLGFAPDQRQGLVAALGQKGIAVGAMAEAGLVIAPEGGGAPCDRFRGRVIFPIRDARGRCIGLGGRAMDPGAPAKYLNSPETPLFDKGRSLYNIGPARTAAGKGAQLVVAEGYMDVIALSEAGFGATVAPLGTAVTEDQLRLMWQVHPEPVIALDGDAAGIRAAGRLVDLALPMLEAGYGLRFALLPGGMDPDDLIRSGGRAAMQQVLDAARPMIALIWQRETEGRSFDSPERRATLDKRLRGVLAQIRDPALRTHYEADLRRLRAELFAALAQPLRPWRGPAGRGSAERASGRAGRAGGGAGPGAPVQPLPATRASPLAAAGRSDPAEAIRVSVVLATFALHPGLIAGFLGALETLETPQAAQARLRAALIGWSPSAETLAEADALAELGPEAGAALREIMASPLVRIAPALRAPGDSARARMAVAEELARLAARRSAEAEIAEAMADVTGEAGEGLTWRLTRAAEALRRADQPAQADQPDFGEDRAALSAGLQRMIDDEVWKRRRS